MPLDPTPSAPRTASPTLPSVYSQSATERVYVGRPAAEAIAAEAAATGSGSVFILCSATLARTTDEIDRIRAALDGACSGTFAQIPAHGSRAAVLAAAAAARAAGADAIVAIGGGSVIDTAKVVSICLKHGLTEHDDLEPYRFGMDAEGRAVRPAYAGPDVRITAAPPPCRARSSMRPAA